MRRVANQAMQAAAKIVTDRRWAATATAMALGFGLFIGVAIGPGAAGTLATGGPQIVEVPSSGGGTENEVGGGGAETTAAPAPPTGGGEEVVEEAPLETAYPSSVPLAPETFEPAPVESPPSTPTKPTPEVPASDEEEPEPEGQTLEGTVVHANPAAGSYALAIEGGELVSVHAAKLPPAGTRLSLPVRQLANGTFAEEEKPERQGKASKASFTGTVTFADPDPAAPSYTVSGRGTSVLVRLQPDPSGAVPTLPPLGSFATVDVRIGRPPAAPDSASGPAPPAPLCDLGPGVLPARAPKPPQSVLWQQRLEVEDIELSAYLEVAGLITGLCVDRSAVLLSADDAGDGGDDLLLALSPKVDAGELHLADSALATVEVAEDGTLTLTGLAGDERVRGADDPKSAQGDLARD